MHVRVLMLMIVVDIQAYIKAACHLYPVLITVTYVVTPYCMTAFAHSAVLHVFGVNSGGFVYMYRVICVTMMAS